MAKRAQQYAVRAESMQAFAVRERARAAEGERDNGKRRAAVRAAKAAERHVAANVISTNIDYCLYKQI